MPSNHPYWKPWGLTWKGCSSNGIGQMHRKGTSGCCQTVMYDPGAKHPDQMFWTGSRALERGGNRSTRGETLESGWDRLRLNPRMIAQERGVNVEYNVSLTPPGITAHGTRVVAHRDINPNQLNIGNQMRTGVLPWTSQKTEISKRITYLMCQKISWNMSQL